jgi:hypothetical protein
LPTENPRLPFESGYPIDPTFATGQPSVPLVIELFRQLGVATTIDAQEPVKWRRRLKSSQLVESLIARRTSGGDRCQDLTTLREDAALAALLGYPLPAATTVRDFFDAFHVEGGPLWQAGPQTAIPVESRALVGLAQANRTLVSGVQQATPAITVTLDVDATLMTYPRQLDRGKVEEWDHHKHLSARKGAVADRARGADVSHGTNATGLYSSSPSANGDTALLYTFSRPARSITFQ